MELYLRWLEKYEKEPGEETPLGLILCAGKASEQIELLQLDKSGIKVAEYMTELPKRKLLEQKLHKAVELARKRLEAKAMSCTTCCICSHISGVGNQQGSCRVD